MKVKPYDGYIAVLVANQTTTFVVFREEQPASDWAAQYSSYGYSTFVKPFMFADDQAVQVETDGQG